MAGKKLNLAEIVKAAAPTVSNSDTDSNTVVMVPREKLKSNSGNFYEIKDVEQLADSIALSGLLHPLLVKPDGDGYVIISGHRRNAAMDILDWPERPCIVRTPINEIIEELMLIEANRTARVITAADTMHQAERYTELLSKLKESGVEIPGRLRDAVAEAMNISASKLARLNKIKNSLSKQWMKEFEKNDIGESVAYALAQLPEEQQSFIYERVSKEKNGIKYLYENTVKGWGTFFDDLTKIKPSKNCKDKKSSCINTPNMIERSKTVNTWEKCRGECCDTCYRNVSCKYVCPFIKPRLDAEKKKKREENASIKAQQKTEAQNLAVRHNMLWIREGYARTQAGVTEEDALNCFGKPWALINKLADYERGDIAESSEYAETNPLYTIDLKGYIKLADLYGVTVDYLLCRTDFPYASVEPQTWLPFKTKPTDGQHCLTLIKMPDDKLHIKEAWYLGGKLCLFNKRDCVIDMQILGWIPVPELPIGDISEADPEEEPAEE